MKEITGTRAFARQERMFMDMLRVTKYWIEERGATDEEFLLMMKSQIAHRRNFMVIDERIALEKKSAARTPPPS